MSRRYALTINNPLDKNIDHDRFKLALGQFKGLAYWCMADEIGLETKTPHIHVFMLLRSPVRFSTVKRHFPEAHIEAARGTVLENRDYVAKSGKWENDQKSDTRVEGSFEESGPPPDEPGQGARTDIAAVYEMIADGMSNAAVMEANPSTAMYIDKMNRIREELLESRYREQWRELDVTYIFGPTATGKTRGLWKNMDIRVYIAQLIIPTRLIGIIKNLSCAWTSTEVAYKSGICLTTWTDILYPCQLATLTA